VVEQIFRIGIANGGAGCCNETQARMRSGGKERLLFSWYQGQALRPVLCPGLRFLCSFDPPLGSRLRALTSGALRARRYRLDNDDQRNLWRHARVPAG
jgi:hypothetical protein